MAVLNESDRALVAAQLMREASLSRRGLPITKAELRAAIDAIDNFIEANQAAINAAFPAAARGGLNARAKADVFHRVALRRTEVL